MNQNGVKWKVMIPTTIISTSTTSPKSAFGIMSPDTIFHARTNPNRNPYLSPPSPRPRLRQSSDVPWEARKSAPSIECQVPSPQNQAVARSSKLEVVPTQQLYPRQLPLVEYPCSGCQLQLRSSMASQEADPQ